MTLEFTTPSGSYTNAIKLSMDIPNLSGIIELVITSRYSQDIIFTNTINIVETNDRYTEFSMNYTDELGDSDYSGLYNYQLNKDSVSIDTGMIKIVNNKTQSLENKTIYVSPNENGDAYVIYK